MTSILTISEVLEVLVDNKKISEDVVNEVKKFVSNNQTFKESAPVKKVTTFTERIQQAGNNITSRLLQTVLDKKSNVCVAVDSVDSQELLKIVEKVGPHVAVIKLHQDIVKDWTDDTEKKLRRLADDLNFLLFEDRKYADIGNTVGLQAARTVNWADLVTVHGVAGPGVLEAVSRSTNQRSVLYLTI